MPIGPTKEQIQALLDSDLDAPVVMLNLLKFAEKAADGDGDRDGDGAQSGRDSYARYGDRVRSMLEETGARVLWQGRADSVVIGGDGDDWDAVILVEYPSRQAFIEMTSSPKYQEVSKDRTAGLADSRLIAMTQLYRHTDE
ncbi:MAG TPA: DUF1330 domain-containing protein [Acidimicrobiia bacterium]|jgi:uncharacterized protein (DUF1330 family)